MAGDLFLGLVRGPDVDECDPSAARPVRSNSLYEEERNEGSKKRRAEAWWRHNLSGMTSPGTETITHGQKSSFLTLVLIFAAARLISIAS